MTTLNHIAGLGLTPRNVFCIGRNYAEHAKELGNAIPTEPVVFLKPTSALCGEETEIRLPAGSTRVDHEVEVVIAIGRGGWQIPESAALAHVAGYAIGIDVTWRDQQDKAKQKGLPWTVAKGLDTFAPLSQFVRASEVGNPLDLPFSLKIDGTLRQEGRTSGMLFSIPQLIAYLSTLFTLAPGDLIFTGTPSGVGPLQSGNRLEAELGAGLARLQVRVK